MSYSDISAPRMTGSASCAPKSVHTKQPISGNVRPPAIPSLMDLKVTPRALQQHQAVEKQSLFFNCLM